MADQYVKELNGGTAIASGSLADGDGVPIQQSPSSLVWTTLANIRAFFGSVFAAKSQTFSVGLGLDGGGSALDTTVSAERIVEKAMTLTSVRLTQKRGQTGSVTVAVKKNGTTLGSIVVSATNSVVESTFSGWSSVAFAAGDRLEIVPTGTPTATYLAANFNGTVTLS